MTLPMDICIASAKASFSMRFIRFGITPEVASTTYLAQIVGLPNALDLVLTARIIDAEEAVQMGLVNDVVAPDRLIDEAMTVANLIAANPLECVMEGKRMVHRHMVEQDIDAVVAEEDRTLLAVQRGPAHKEAVRSFLEKREPRFNRP